MNKFWLWVWKNEWIPLGFLAPYVLGWVLRSKPHRVKEVSEVERHTSDGDVGKEKEEG